MKEETKNKLKAKIIDFIGLIFIVFFPIFIFILCDIIFSGTLWGKVSLPQTTWNTLKYMGIITALSGFIWWALVKNESWGNAWKISHNNFENDEDYEFGNLAKEEDL